MADVFYDGMLNVVEELNKMQRAFAAGPYNAVPLTGGTMTGGLTAPSILSSGNSAARPRARLGETEGGEPSVSLARWSGSGINDISWRIANKNGLLQMEFAGSGALGAQAFVPALSLNYSGNLLVGTSNGAAHTIQNVNQAQGQVNLSLTNCATFYVSSGSYGNSAACSLNVNANGTTGRGISTGGTINASGADYAEYLIKALLCGAIVPGQIVGIDAAGKLTDKWDRAITFVAKSTNPCMVGGDSWAQELGVRPAAPVRVLPVTDQELVSPAVPADEASGAPAVAAVYRSVTIAPGDTDEAWAAKEAAHIAAAQDFDAALEALRQTVDRIAIAGRVPVNVLGAQPGDYIVPVQDGAGIKGISVRQADLSHLQYLQAIGRVISIEPDGRAYVMVKVV